MKRTTLGFLPILALTLDCDALARVYEEEGAKIEILAQYCALQK